MMEGIIAFGRREESEEFLRALGSSLSVPAPEGFYGRERRSAAEALCASVTGAERLSGPVWCGTVAVLENGVVALCGPYPKTGLRKGACVLAIPVRAADYAASLRKAGSWNRMSSAASPDKPLSARAAKELLDHWNEPERTLVLDFRPTRREIAVLDALLSQASPWTSSPYISLEIGRRYRWQEALSRPVTRSQLSHLWETLRAFREGRPFSFRMEYFPSILFSHWAPERFHQNLKVTPSGVISPGSRITALSLANLRTDELAPYLLAFSDIGTALRDWAKKGLSPGFLRRIRTRPVTIAFRTWRKNSRVSLTLSSAKEGIAINGIAFPTGRAREFLADRGMAYIHSQAGAMASLRRHAIYTADELETLSIFPRKMSVPVAGQSVELHIRPVKRRGRWSVACEGRSYPTTYRRMKAAIHLCKRDHDNAGSGLFRILTALGIPPGNVADFVLKKAAESREADRKARGLLTQIIRDNKGRVRILSERRGLLSMLVKGRMRDYRVILQRGSVSVRRHPSGGTVCIEDRQKASCPMDKFVSRVMALLNDEHLKGRISTLRNHGEEPDFILDQEALETANRSVMTLMTDLTESGAETGRRRLMTMLRQLNAYRSALLETRFNDRRYPAGLFEEDE